MSHYRCIKKGNPLIHVNETTVLGSRRSTFQKYKIRLERSIDCCAVSWRLISFQAEFPGLYFILSLVDVLLKCMLLQKQRFLDYDKSRERESSLWSCHSSVIWGETRKQNSYLAACTNDCSFILHHTELTLRQLIIWFSPVVTNMFPRPVIVIDCI